MRWPGMDRSRLGRGELVLYPYIATAGEAPGRPAGGVGFRSGYARPTADPTGQLRVADRPMSLSREREFGISISKQTLSRELRAMRYRKLSARPRHHAQDPDAVAAFKKTSPPTWRRS